MFTLVVVATGNLTAVIIAHIFYNIIARLSQGTETTTLIVAGLVVLVVYGTWLLYGAGVLERFKEISAAQPAPEARDSGRVKATH